MCNTLQLTTYNSQGKNHQLSSRTFGLSAPPKGAEGEHLGTSPFPVLALCDKWDNAVSYYTIDWLATVHLTKAFLLLYPSTEKKGTWVSDTSQG